MNIKEDILLNNHHFIAFNKPNGMAVQSIHQKEESLEVILRNYCKIPLQLIHRIDQPCSGIVLFGKKKSSAAYLHDLMSKQLIIRQYLAVVPGKPKDESGTLVHYLFAHKQSNKTFVVDEHHKEGKLSRLDYRWIGSISDHRHIIALTLNTGRHHQIRVQLATIGWPIDGDRKYGSKTMINEKGIALHSWKMKFPHPVDKTEIQIEAGLPNNELWKGVHDLLKK